MIEKIMNENIRQHRSRLTRLTIEPTPIRRPLESIDPHFFTRENRQDLLLLRREKPIRTCAPVRVRVRDHPDAVRNRISERPAARKKQEKKKINDEGDGVRFAGSNVDKSGEARGGCKRFIVTAPLYAWHPDYRWLSFDFAL